MTTNIFKFNSLQVIPDPFCRIQIWRISRQLNQLHSLATSLLQELPEAAFEIGLRLAREVAPALLDLLQTIAADEPLALRGLLDIADDRELVSMLLAVPVDFGTAPAQVVEGFLEFRGQRRVDLAKLGFELLPAVGEQVGDLGGALQVK